MEKILDLEDKIRIFRAKSRISIFMTYYLEPEKMVEDIYKEANFTLMELSKSKHQASSVKSRLLQSLTIWYFIFFVSIPLSLPTLEYFYSRKDKPELSHINLVSIVVTVMSAINCITLGTAQAKMRFTLDRASKNFNDLSQSLYESQVERVSNEG